MKPYGQRMGADDYDGADLPVAVVLKARARTEGVEECRDGLEDVELVTGRVCACGAHMGRRVHRCFACREARRVNAQRKGGWDRLSPGLAVRTCACGIVFALKYEEPRCSICRARPCDRRGMKVKTCVCGARFAAKGTQAWCDGCRLKGRKNEER